MGADKYNMPIYQRFMVEHKKRSHESSHKKRGKDFSLPLLLLLPCTVL